MRNVLVPQTEMSIANSMHGDLPVHFRGNEVALNTALAEIYNPPLYISSLFIPKPRLALLNLLCFFTFPLRTKIQYSVVYFRYMVEF